MHFLPKTIREDETLALRREGYTFIQKRCDALRTDVFETRLMLRKAICMRGAEAAELFYSRGKFTRVGAMPVTVLKLLQDFHSVQLLDGDAHRHRKAMFLALSGPDQSARLSSLFEEEWRELFRTQSSQRIVLFDVARLLLTRAALRWAALPLGEVERRTREFSEMIESTGSVGPRNWRAQILRARSERWARRIIRQTREAHPGGPPRSVVETIALHRDLQGHLLDTATAAVELLNVLRPTVACARFIVYAAKYLHENPSVASRIRAGDESYLHAFVEEVRRISAFFPFVGGRVLEAFTWNGVAFPSGAWVLLDLYGTNHDARIWTRPNELMPDRLLAREPTPFEFVPQGAGETSQTHRCPGERLTTELIKVAVRMLSAMTYTVPLQDLSVDLSVIPALPKSGFVLTEVRPA